MCVKLCAPLYTKGLQDRPKITKITPKVPFPPVPQCFLALFNALIFYPSEHTLFSRLCKDSKCFINQTMELTKTCVAKIPNQLASRPACAIIKPWKGEKILEKMYGELRSDVCKSIVQAYDVNAKIVLSMLERVKKEYDKLRFDRIYVYMVDAESGEINRVEAGAASTLRQRYRIGVRVLEKAYFNRIQFYWKEGRVYIIVKKPGGDYVNAR